MIWQMGMDMDMNMAWHDMMCDLPVYHVRFLYGIVAVVSGLWWRLLLVTDGK